MWGHTLIFFLQRFSWLLIWMLIFMLNVINRHLCRIVFIFLHFNMFPMPLFIFSYNFILNFTLVIYCRDYFSKFLIYHGKLTQNTQVESTRFVQVVWKSMGVGICCLCHSQRPRFFVHFQDESFIAFFLLQYNLIFSNPVVVLDFWHCFWMKILCSVFLFLFLFFLNFMNE